MGRPSTIVPLEVFKEHALKANGVMIQTAYSIGVSGFTIKRWIDKHPEYKEALQEAKDIALLTGETRPNIVPSEPRNPSPVTAFAVEPPSLEEFQEIADANKGILYQIANELGVHRTAVSKWVNTYPEFKAAIKSAKELVLDNIERVVISLAESGDKDAYKLYLKSIGKSRGYVERQEILTATVGFNPEEIEDLDNLDDRL